MKLEVARTLSLETGVLAMAGVTDGSRLYAACVDGRVYEVSPESQEIQPFEGGHTSYASGCVLTPDGKVLITGGYDGHLCWHDVATKKEMRRIKAHDFWSWDLALAPDGRFVATVTGQFLVGSEKYEPLPSALPTVKVFDVHSGELVHGWELLPPVLSVTFSPDGRHLAAATMMGEVRVWDLATGKPAGSFKTPDFSSWGIIKSPHYLGGIYGLTFAPDGASVLGCGMGPMVDPMAGNGKMTWQRWSWNEPSPRLLTQVKDSERGSGLMETIGFAPDKKTFVMAGRQAQGTWNAALFNESDGGLLASLDTKGRITGHHFTGDGRLLYLGAAAGQGERKDGKWPAWGKIHQVKILDTPA
jgi:WD40 repeat protein